MIITQNGTTKRFIDQALDELVPPKTLVERNFVQLMLAERVACQCGTSVLEAMQVVSPMYAGRFPHRLS